MIINALPVPRPRLPWDLKLAAAVCILFSALVGMSSAGEAMALTQRPDLDDSQNAALLSKSKVNPETLERLQRAQLSALEGMRGARGVTLTLLAMATGFSLIGGMRLLRPGGMPRHAIRRLTAGSAMIAGVLRTLDGAQQAAVAKRSAAPLMDLLLQLFPSGDVAAEELLRARAGSMAVVGTSFVTLVVAGTFLLLWQYLRSERARTILDGPEAGERPV